jgi:hypothetical protein
MVSHTDNFMSITKSISQVTALYTALLDIEDDIKDSANSFRVDKYKVITSDCEADLEELQDLITINSRRRNDARTAGVKAMVEQVRLRLQEHVNTCTSIYESQALNTVYDQESDKVEVAVSAPIYPPIPSLPPVENQPVEFQPYVETVTDSGDDYIRESELLKQEDEELSDSGSDRTISGPAGETILTPPESDAGRPYPIKSSSRNSNAAPKGTPDKPMVQLHEKVTSWNTATQGKQQQPSLRQKPAARAIWDGPPSVTKRARKTGSVNPEMSRASMWSTERNVGNRENYSSPSENISSSAWSTRAEAGDYSTYQDSGKQRRGSAVSKLKTREKSTDELLAEIADEEDRRDAYPRWGLDRPRLGKGKMVQFTEEEEIFYPQQPQPYSPDGFGYTKYGGAYGPIPMKPRYYPTNDYNNQYSNHPDQDPYNSKYDSPYQTPYGATYNAAYNQYPPYAPPFQNKPEGNRKASQAMPRPEEQPIWIEPDSQSWMHSSGAQYFVDKSGIIWAKPQYFPPNPSQPFPPSPKFFPIPASPEPTPLKPMKSKNRTKSRSAPKAESKVEIIEKPLLLSLEEVFRGTKKQMKVKRQTYDTKTGTTDYAEKILVLPIKKGIRVGTKIKFADSGDQGPGTTQDIHFVISEVCQGSTTLPYHT